METIQCPNCGSGQVKDVTDDKYVCLACDNVFLIHNLSKEFKRTDEHLSDVHKDLKNDIRTYIQNGGVDEGSLLERAEKHMNMGNWDAAYEVYEDVAKNFPDHASGWFGMYRAETEDFTAVERYALYACGGVWNSEEDEELAEGCYFYGAKWIFNALNCSDADENIIKDKVARFLSDCANAGKENIEHNIRKFYGKACEMQDEIDRLGRVRADGKSSDKLKSYAPALVALFLLIVSVSYFIASGDWLGKLIGGVASMASLSLLLKKLFSGSARYRVEAESWDSIYKEKIVAPTQNRAAYGNELMMLCTDLDNYNLVLRELNGPDFMGQYLYGFREPLRDSKVQMSAPEDFLKLFCSGGFERFNYLRSI